MSGTDLVASAKELQEQVVRALPDALARRVCDLYTSADGPLQVRRIHIGFGLPRGATSAYYWLTVDAQDWLSDIAIARICLEVP